MCDPVSGTMAAVSAASALTNTATSLIREKAASEAQNSANLHSARQAIKEQLDLSDLDGIKTQRKNAALSQNSLKIKRAAMEQSAKARSSNLSTGSKNALERDYSRSLGLSQGLIDAESDYNKNQSLLSRGYYKDDAQGRISGLRSYSGTNPWLRGIDTSLQIGSGLLGAYKYGTKNKK